MPNKQMSEEFASWIDSFDDVGELTIGEILLMQESWNAAAAMERHRRSSNPTVNERLSQPCP